MKGEAFRPCKMLSEVQSKCGVRGRTGYHEQESTPNGNMNPQEGGGQRASEEEGTWLNINP